jgi:outer membrane protein assembly factor BamB
MTIRLLLVVAAVCSVGQCARADDWPQFRGPNRDGISNETGLLNSWPKHGPPLLWTYTDAGVGYAGPAVIGGRLYTMGARGETEYLFALDLKTHKEVWAAKVGTMFIWKENEWNPGPNATPTVAGGRVYALGSQGFLVCVDAATGKVYWRHDLPREMAADVNPIGGGPEKMGWGFAWSPLVDGDCLICVPGGSEGTVAALDAKTGKVLWRSTGFTDRASYASPIAAKLAGVRQYVVLTNEGLSGVAANDGKRLWHVDKEFPDVTIPTPLVHGDEVYATGYKGGCMLVKVARTGSSLDAVKVYANRNMDNRQGSVVLVYGHVCGYAEYKGWVCQDFKTGKVLKTDRRSLDRGALIYADGRLYCYGEQEGTLVLVDASPDRWERGAVEGVRPFHDSAAFQARQTHGQRQSLDVPGHRRLAPVLARPELAFLLRHPRGQRRPGGPVR